MERTMFSHALLAAFVFAASAALHSVPTVAQATIPDKLVITDDQVGTGPELRKGMFAVLHYTGWVYDGTAVDGKGKRYVSSRERQEPLSYVYGYGRAIKGFERGIQGMRGGGKRTIVIPPRLGYAEPRHPYPKDVPEGSALIFEVELLNVVPQGAPPDS